MDDDRPCCQLYDSFYSSEHIVLNSAPHAQQWYINILNEIWTKEYEILHSPLMYRFLLKDPLWAILQNQIDAPHPAPSFCHHATTNYTLVS